MTVAFYNVPHPSLPFYLINAKCMESAAVGVTFSSPNYFALPLCVKYGPQFNF